MYDLINRDRPLTEDMVWERIIKTIVHYCDSSTQSVWVEEVNLWNIISDIELEQAQMFNLFNRDQGVDRYIPATSVHMIDMPLYQVVDAAKQEYQELEADMKSTEVFKKAKKECGKPNKSSQKK